RLGPIAPKPPDDPDARLAAFTVPAQVEGINRMIETGLREAGVEEVTSKYREGERVIRGEGYAYLRPTVVYCDSPDHALSNTEYMFPFVSVVECPQEKMLERIGQTLVATAITSDECFRSQLIN